MVDTGRCRQRIGGLCAFVFLTAGSAMADGTGPELIANGDFEAGFDADGVAAGWTGFGTGAGAVLKPNPRLGRIGGGVYGAAHWNEAIGQWDDDYQTIRLHGKAHLVDAGRFDVVTRLQNELGPEVITVAKLGMEAYFHEIARRDPLQGDLIQNGREFADHCYQRSQDSGHWAHCYYGFNEPDMNNAGTLRKVAIVERGFTERLHELGLRSIVLNHSTGTPGPMENMLIDEVRDLLAVADYVGYHCYGGPSGFFMCHPDSLTYHSLRWRIFAGWYEDRGWRFPPVIYTEATTWWGWHKDHSATAVRDDLLCFADHMKEDAWAVGLNIFCTGHWPGQVWHDWCVTEYPGRVPNGPNLIVDACRTHNMNNPVDARSGTGSQEILAEGSRFSAGIVQQIPTRPGRVYRFSAWFRHEFTGGWPHRTEILIGFDPTGQTASASAATVQWSADLVGGNGWETDIWYRHETTFTAAGNATSVWLRGRKTSGPTKVRVYFDDVSARDTGEVAAEASLATY